MAARDTLIKVSVPLDINQAGIVQSKYIINLSRR
jgi:hypothetical protein